MPRRAQRLLFKIWLAAFSLQPAAVPAGTPQKKHLSIVHAALLEAEGGLEAPAGAIYQPGETLYLAFYIEGYTKDRSGRVKLAYSIDALDPKGVPFVQPEVSRIDTELAPEDARWRPRVTFSPALPPFADSGAYRFVIHVTDELANAQASQEVPFQVRGRDVAPSATLVVRNFHFSRQEDGEPLETAAYRRGDTVWASFDITGYKIEANNAIRVEYVSSVLNSEGKVIFQQPQPAEEDGSSFYPRRYVHAVFNLDLESTIPAGKYTIVLKVHDKLGNQSNESRHTFTVE
jgi:hypothetical protein